MPDVLPTNACRICQQVTNPPHWGNECPLKDKGKGSGNWIGTSPKGKGMLGSWIGASPGGQSQSGSWMGTSPKGQKGSGGWMGASQKGEAKQGKWMGTTANSLGKQGNWMGTSQGQKGQWTGTTLPGTEDARMGAGTSPANLGAADPWGNGADPWAQFSATNDSNEASRKRGRVAHAGLEQPAPQQEAQMAPPVSLEELSAMTERFLQQQKQAYKDARSLLDRSGASMVRISAPGITLQACAATTAVLRMVNDTGAERHIICGKDYGTQPTLIARPNHFGNSQREDTNS